MPSTTTCPPGRIWKADPDGCGLDIESIQQLIGGGCQNTPWCYLMLPQFEQQALHDAFNFDLGLLGPSLKFGWTGWIANSTVIGSKLGVFQCPSDRSLTWRFSPASPAPLLVAAGDLQQGELCGQLGKHPVGPAGHDHPGPDGPVATLGLRPQWPPLIRLGHRWPGRHGFHGRGPSGPRLRNGTEITSRFHTGSGTAR